MPICYRLSVWLSCKNRLPTYCVYCVGADVKQYTIQSNPPVCKICLNSRVRTVSRWLVVSVAEFHAHVTAKRWYEVLAGMNSRTVQKSKDGTKNPWYKTSTVRKVHLWYETTMVRKVWFLPHPSSFSDSKFHPEILGFPRAGALNEGGVGEIGDFRTLSRHISETVQDRTKVGIDH